MTSNYELTEYETEIMNVLNSAHRTWWTYEEICQQLPNVRMGQMKRALETLRGIEYVRFEAGLGYRAIPLPLRPQPTHADSANAAPDVSGDAAYFDDPRYHTSSPEHLEAVLEIEALKAANRALDRKVAACLAIDARPLTPDWLNFRGDKEEWEEYRMKATGANEMRDEFRAILLSDAAQAESDESEGA